MLRSRPPPSSTAAPNSGSDEAGDESEPLTAANATNTPQAAAKHRRKLSVRVAAVSRWLHIYLSMFGLFVILFFSVTGLTLNHPDWFSEKASTSEAEGALEPKWVKLPAPPLSEATTAPDFLASVAKFEVVEYLRKTHAIRGAVADFTADDRECVVVFKGPGHSADIFIDRDTGKYRLTQTAYGLIAVINDLHKGRDTGTAWSIVIDVSAVLMTLASLSGLILLFYIKRRRVPGVMTALVGTALILATIYFLVP